MKIKHAILTSFTLLVLSGALFATYTQQSAAQSAPADTSGKLVFSCKGSIL